MRTYKEVWEYGKISLSDDDKTCKKKVHKDTDNVTLKTSKNILFILNEKILVIMPMYAGTE